MSEFGAKVVLTIEAIITFDPGIRVPKNFNQTEIRNEVAAALAGCSQIEEVASVYVSVVSTQK